MPKVICINCLREAPTSLATVLRNGSPYWGVVPPHTRLKRPLWFCTLSCTQEWWGKQGGTWAPPADNNAKIATPDVF